MGESIRVTAKTVEDAITEASIQLGTSRENIEYTVIEKGSAGFLGILGGKKAIIEAKKKFTDEDLMKEVFGEKKEEKPKKEFRKEEKKDFKKEKKEVKKDFKREVKEQKKEIKKEEKVSKEEYKREEKPQAQESQREERAPKDSFRQEERPVKEESREEVKAIKEEIRSSKEEHGDVKGRREDFRREGRYSERRPRRDGRDFERRPRQNYEKRGPAKPEIRPSAEVLEQEPKVDAAPRAPKVPADSQEATRRAEEFLYDVFKTMDMQVELKSVFEDDTLSIDLDGENMGILIGKRGQTLDSLQYLTSLVVNKGKASYVRVKLDTEDYRERRKATLENLARNIAFKVKKTRRPVFLEPMNPYERRIIHSALQNDPFVTTHSEGDEPCRKVVVTLKKRERQQNSNYMDRKEYMDKKED